MASARPTVAPIFVPLADAARVLGVSEAVLGRAISRGELRVLRPDGHELISVAEFETWKEMDLARPMFGPFPRYDRRLNIPVRAATDTRRIPAAVRRLVWARDKGRCVYCGDTEGPFQFDHVRPFILGGQSTADNLVLACGPCNRSKGSRGVVEWRAGQ
jgi:hypothetical protein